MMVGDNPEFTADDINEMKNASAYASKRQNKAREIAAEIGNLGFLSLFWDCKVPEKKKTFFKRISLGVSDPNILKEEIEKHEKFYAEMRTAIINIRYGSGKNDDKDAEKLILDLYKNLSEMAELAKSDLLDTNSKILFKLHKNFLEKHDKLENMLKRVECVIQKDQLRKVRAEMQEALLVIEKLTEEIKKDREESKKMRKDFDDLKLSHERLLKQQADLLTEQRKTTDLLETLLKKF